jgi:hypothetical protein
MLRSKYDPRFLGLTRDSGRWLQAVSHGFTLNQVLRARLTFSRMPFAEAVLMKGYANPFHVCGSDPSAPAFPG